MAAVVKEESLEAAGRVYAHELGHALNICHKPDSDLMRAGAPKALCQQLASEMPADVPKGDFKDARVCGLGVRGMARQEDIVLALFQQFRRIWPFLKLFMPFMPLVW